MTPEERFRAKIDTTGGPDACWPWRGACGQLGQPVVCVNRKHISGRRFAWKLAHGEFPGPKRWIRVTCKNHRCLNPKHLALRSVTDDVARFWEKVDRRGPDECWPWIGYVDATGYGRFSPLGGERTRQAHRVAWEVSNNRPIPTDTAVEIVVMHSCDNRRCCNPAHLSLGTDADNMRDMEQKGRRYCKLRKDMYPSLAIDRASGMTQAQMATKYGVSPGCIQRHVKRAVEQHKGDTK